MAFFIPIILGYLQEAFRHGYFHSSFSTEHQESELDVTSCGLFRKKFEAKPYTPHQEEKAKTKGKNKQTEKELMKIIQYGKTEFNPNIQLIALLLTWSIAI